MLAEVRSQNADDLTDGVSAAEERQYTYSHYYGNRFREDLNFRAINQGLNLGLLSIGNKVKTRTPIVILRKKVASCALPRLSTLDPSWHKPVEETGSTLSTWESTPRPFAWKSV